MRVLGDECFPQRAGTGGRCALPSWVSKEPAGGSRGGPGEARGTTACPQARNSCRPAPSAQVGCLRRVEANSCFHISRVGALHETHSPPPPPLCHFSSLGFRVELPQLYSPNPKPVHLGKCVWGTQSLCSCQYLFIAVFFSTLTTGSRCLPHSVSICVS